VQARLPAVRESARRAVDVALAAAG
jgi:hypothetical protein